MLKFYPDSGKPMTHHDDAVKVAPESYKVSLENDHSRKEALDVHNTGVHRFWLPYSDDSLGQIKKRKKTKKSSTSGEWKY